VAESQLVCVGSYTADSGRNGEGIGIFWRDSATNALSVAGTLVTPSPSWLVWHPSVPMLYAANEAGEGSISVISLGEGGRLTILDVKPSGGADPCHLALSEDGRFLFCANYTGGSLAAFALDPDGRILERTDLVVHAGTGPDSGRQEAAHVHMAVPGHDDAGAIVSAVDLGTDEIRSYRVSSSGKLSPLAVSALPPGTGPRQLVRRPGSDLAFVVGELAGTLITVREGPTGIFAVVATIPATTPASAGTPNLAAHLELDGDRLYLSNRGPDCVTEFDLDAAARAVVDHASGRNPRHFTILNGHCYVAAQDDDAVVAFSLANPTESDRYAVGCPTCVTAAPNYS
jgi:6-phosphogluconolactonase (cycloisomerase 2 family)